MNRYHCIVSDVHLGIDGKLSKFINLYCRAIGDGITIRAFVEIQKNAKVGAGSVVTHDVLDNAIVAGTPAKLLRLIAPALRVAS